MNKMNYRAIALQELVSYAKEQPDYTLAEVLYSFLRRGMTGAENIKDIRNLSDEELYSVIENVREIESPEKE